MTLLLRDLVHAARALRKSPVFAATAVVTIALGIGASTAIFSVTNAILLRPLPYKGQDRLVLACMDLKARGVKDLPISNAAFFDLRSGSNAFEDIAAVSAGRNVMPRDDGTSERVRFASVTPNFFRLLGAKIAAGRDFEDNDGQPQDSPDVQGAAPRLPTIAILSHQYWQRRYGGSSTVLGRGMLNNGSSGPQIVGVLAPGFELLLPPSMNVEPARDVWFAARLGYDAANRNNFSLRPIARLKEGVSLDRAQAEADAVAAEIRKTHGVSQSAGFHIRLEPMQEYLSAAVRPAILALMGAVVFLLLIACANVANLLLVRASLRERELAVRAALGGTRWSLVSQVLAESLLISGLGTVLGLGLAWAGIRALHAIAPANLPRMDAIAISPVVLGFSALAGLAAAGVFGMAPVWRVLQPDVIYVLRASGRTAGLGGGRILRNGVVIVEVALCFVLLVGSGLMFRSFLALQRIDPGFDPKSLLTFQVLGGRGRPDPAPRAAFVREIQSRLSSLPGVESVTAASPFPLAGGFNPIRWGTAEAQADPSKFQAVDYQVVLPGYFQTMRTPLLAGRTFTEADNAPSRNGVIVDSVLAAKAFPNESAVGKRILIRLRTPEAEWVEILGVVAHQRNTSLADAGREQIYFTDGFLGHGSANRWALRVTGDPARYAGAARVKIAELDARLLIAETQSMDALVLRAQAGTRFSLLLIGAFAAIAALLAGVGLYGVLSTVVRQRTAEIGVRMAVGAAPSGIFRLVVGQGLLLSTAGIAAGFAAALALTRAMSSMLVGVGATDPATFAAMALLFLVVAAIASWVPARRAAALDPISALREE